MARIRKNNLKNIKKSIFLFATSFIFDKELGKSFFFGKSFRLSREMGVAKKYKKMLKLLKFKDI